MNIIEAPCKRVLPQRTRAIRAVVLHHTGSTDEQKILAYYCSPEGLQPHYYVNLAGKIYRHVDEKRIAYHCAIMPEEAALYAKGFSHWSRFAWNDGKPKDMGGILPNYVDWRDLWQPVAMQSPLDLVTGRYPNDTSIGIELQSPTHGEHTEAQYIALAELCAAIWLRHRVPLIRSHVITHYDCSPMRRSNARGATDPPKDKFQYKKLWDALRPRKGVG